MKTNRPFLSIAAVAAILASVDGASAANNALLQESVRSANARFADVATAVKEGYAPIPCVSASRAAPWGSITSMPA